MQHIFVRQNHNCCFGEQESRKRVQVQYVEIYSLNKSLKRFTASSFFILFVEEVARIENSSHRLFFARSAM